MHHQIRNVATSRFFDPDQFSTFAWNNREKYSVVGSEEYPTVSTWHVNDLVQDFKDHLGADYYEHRKLQIEKQQSARAPGM